MSIGPDQIRNRQFKLALFDLDGTLVDSAPDLTAAVNFSLQANGYSAVSEAQVRQWIGNGAAVLVDRALAFSRRCSVADIDTSSATQAYQHFLDYYQQHTVVNTLLYPGARTLLAHWAEAETPVSMGIVTNKPSQFTRPVCVQLKIDHYFDLMYSGNTFPVRKPDPAPLLKACEATGAEVNETIMIGDSVNDLIAARRAGMTAVCVSYGYNHGENIAESNPDMLIDSLLELM